MIQIQPVYAEREKWLALAKREGLAFEALEMSMPMCLNDPETLKRIASWYAGTGLVRTVHGVFIDVNPASGDALIREISRRRCIESCEAARMTGAERVVFHASAHPYLGGGYLDHWAGECADFYLELAEKYGVTITVENSQDAYPNALRTLMRRCNDPRVQVCLDVGHAADSARPIEEWFGELAPWIGQIHLSDNLASLDDHLILGEGDIDWRMVDRQWRGVGAPECLTLEVGGLGGVEKSLAFLRINGLFGLEPEEGAQGEVISDAFIRPGWTPPLPEGGAIQRSVLRDMSEGVLLVGMDGVIRAVNPAAEKMLDRLAADLVGRRFVSRFFEYSENDAFNQIVLDAIYDETSVHRGIVPYFTGSEMKQMHVTTSFLHEGERRIGVIAVLDDISELIELRDEVKAMERIRQLNQQLEMRNRLISRAFGRFLSDDIVRELLDRPDGLTLGGRKARLTVMMSDLRGFTAMSERMQPLGLIDMLNHYLGEMTDVIQSRGGTIIEFIGDGIMAIFGAPVSLPRQAESAVAAAIEMQQRMQAVNEWNGERGYPALEMGIALNTGEMIVGNIGSEKRTKYGVVGSMVNLAGRMEAYSVGGQILISPETRREIEAQLSVEREIEMTPKGAGQPITISSVTGMGAPYNLDCRAANVAPEPLDHPVTVSYRMIRDKQVEGEAKPARMTALSASGCVLAAEGLNLYDNLEMDIGGALYAKVTDAAPGAATLRFTAKPDGFAAWLAGTLGEAQG